MGSATLEILPVTVESLCARALGGEKAAWNELIALHRHRVLVALLADGLSLSAADEVCQETWSRLWAQQQRGALERLELPGLAVTQARFLARDRFRQEKVRALRPEPEAQTTEVESAIISRQQLERVSAALARCTAHQQRIFLLAQQDGLPHAEIASQVGLSLQRVRQIIFEVRTKLRAELEVE
jgi:RNA polymerase sigma factor (sigma-70 family)